MPETHSRKIEGLSSELNNHISRLAMLLKHLPKTLPLLEPDTYSFNLNDGDIKEEGLGFALNRCLELAFHTHLLVTGALIKLTHRRESWGDLCSLLRTGAKKLTPTERAFAVGRWVERLTLSAQVTDNEPEPESRKAPAAPPQQTSILAFAQPVDKTELLKQQPALNDKFRKEKMSNEEQDAKEKAEMAEKKSKDNRERQQRWRDRQKALKAKNGKSVGQKAKEGVLGREKGVGGAVTVVMSREEVAEMSHGKRGEWKIVRNGKKGGVKQKRHTRMNYYHPYLWVHINAAEPQVAWSPKLMVALLQSEHPILFQSLHRGTISKWISKNNRKCWSTATRKNVERRSTLAGTGRLGILANHGAIVDEVKEKLKGLRKSGLCIGRLLARSIFLAVIQEREPKLLETFKSSEHFVGHFLESVMNWSMRKGTRASAHVPADAQAVCEREFFRLVNLVSYYDIPPELLINMDQTGIIILMTKNQTYAQTGSSQVDVHGQNEKRAYTLCVATTPAGNILPFQQVWSGKTSGSLPTAAADGMDLALEYGFDFTVADSKKANSHFSTLKTMKEWMNNILRPYVAAFVAEKNLPDDQKSILFINCYPVHIGEPFQVFVLEDFPNVFLIFVPANCTGIFQPADVSVQKIVKHFISQKALDFLVQSHQEQLRTGLTPNQVRFTTSLKALRDASVRPIVDLYTFLANPIGVDVIKRAWQKCSAGEWNLGSECIWNLKSRAAFRRYLQSDQILCEEISAKVSADALAFPAATGVEEMIDDEDLEVLEDHASEIPFGHVIESELQLPQDPAQSATGDSFCVLSETVQSVNGLLLPSEDPENIWAYNSDGTPLNLQK